MSFTHIQQSIEGVIWSEFVVDARYNWNTVVRFWNPPDVVGQRTASLWRGVQTMVQLSLVSLLPALMLGIIVGVARTSRNRFMNQEVALGLNPFTSGMLGLGTSTAAFMAEAVRAGIRSIPQDQWEAAHSLGLDYLRIMCFVILLQALKRIIPPTVSQFIWNPRCRELMR